jgi:Lipoprotein LpqB beta-propeller domain/Sporulation and spore germination
VSRRRLLLAPLAALAALGVALAATSCGVPGRTGVVEDGPGSGGNVETGYGGEDPPPGPEGTGNNVEEFVRRFLEASAGDWDSAAKRVQQFLSPQARQDWQEPREITVVRLVNGKPEIKPGPNPEVTLKVQQIGVLTNRGTLEQPTSQMDTYRFTVGGTTEPRGGLAVLDPPPVMLLTDTGLSRWYELRTIYFWDTIQRNLVPDVRYLPRTLDDSKRYILLIDWLIGGPAGWLRPSVLELPDGTKQLQNAYKNNGRLYVNLSSAASGQGLDRLLAQLSWSLRADFTGEVVLQIESQNPREGTASDYFNHNPVHRLSDRGVEQFAVAGGVVRRVQTEGEPAQADVPLEPDVNKNVRFAAISNGYAALVRHDGGQLRLWLGPTQQQRITGTSLRAAAMSRPVLADGQATGYVAAGGRLYQFDADAAKVTEMTVSGLPGAVTSVALAPDGRRLAVVAAGRPYLVALSGDAGGSAGVARPVPPPVGGLTGISWLNETSLAMIGTNRGKPALVRVTLDGAVTTPQQEVTAAPVTGLVSFPEDPVSGIGGRIMVEADDRTYQVYSSTIEYLPPEKLAGQPPAKGQVLSAPFFME